MEIRQSAKHTATIEKTVNDEENVRVVTDNAISDDAVLERCMDPSVLELERAVFAAARAKGLVWARPEVRDRIVAALKKRG